MRTYRLTITVEVEAESESAARQAWIDAAVELPEDGLGDELVAGAVLADVEEVPWDVLAEERERLCR